MQRVLEGGDQDLASVVPSHFALLDQGDCCYQRLDGGGVLPSCGVLNCPGNGGAGDCPVTECVKVYNTVVQYS